MTMPTMENTTFIICARIDCQERMDNLDFCISFLQDNYPSKIIIMEEDATSKIAGRYHNVNHVFIESLFPIFQRTRLVNKAVNEIVTDPYFCLLDMDVFIDPETYVEAVRLLGEYSVVYPFDGRFYEIPQKYNKIKGLKTSMISEGDKAMINYDSVGGAIFFRSFDFIRGGMENEFFLGWGHEDAERYERFDKLGFKIKRTGNPMYHFTHPRGINSSGKNPHVRSNEQERGKINSMSRDELIRYMDSHFHWCRKRHILKISIVIPTYEMGGKGADFLQYNLSRIFAQTYPFYDIIISDHSLNNDIENLIAAIDDKRISYIRNTEKRGSSSANLNHGVLHASGDIIKPMFQDDFFYNIHALHILYNTFTAGHKWASMACNHSKDRVAFYNDFTPYYNPDIVYGRNTMSSPSCIAYKRDCGVMWDERLLWLMDCKFYRDMYDRYGEPYIIKDVLVTNFSHEGQVTNTMSGETKRAEIALMESEFPKPQ